MIHATDDDIVPAAHSTGYAEEASAAGDPVQTLILPRGGHLGFLDMNNQAWRHAREGIISAFPP
ncbi:MAG: S9 family peptidase [Acidimicrobiia bacterium]|nr:S9 family peptidase [Acidimicrobiia bacterium]